MKHGGSDSKQGDLSNKCFPIGDFGLMIPD